jgi:hypothetical protein
VGDEVGQVGVADVAGLTAAAFLEAAAAEGDGDQRVEALHRHGGEVGFGGRFEFEAGGDAADAAEAIFAVAGQL